MPLDAKQRGAVARILVGAERGTGFLVHPDGYVLTALHCVARSSEGEEGEPDWRRGTIRLRFGDPRDRAAGPHDAGTATLAQRTAQVAAFSIRYDVALLKLDAPVTTEPIELGPGAFGNKKWWTFGFPTSSGAVGEQGSNEVNGQELSGQAAGLSNRIQLTLDQITAEPTTFAGISGAPIVMGTRAVGVCLQELRQNGVVAQNLLYGVHIEALVRADSDAAWVFKLENVPALPWQHESALEREMVAALAQLAPERLRLAARPLGLSEESEGLASRTAAGLLTRALLNAATAFTDHLMPWLQPPPSNESLGLLLCGARIPAHVVATVTPVLAETQQAVARSVHLGASALTARALVFRFAMQGHGIHACGRAIIVLDPLVGTEDAAELAKQKFRKALIHLNGVDEAKFEQRRKIWEKTGRIIYVIADIGAPPELATVLGTVYQHVRIVLRGPPPLRFDDDAAAPELIVPECVSADLEQAFDDTVSLFET